MTEWTVDVDRRIYKGIQIGMDRGFIAEHDPVVIVTGMKLHWFRPANVTHLRAKPI